MDARACATTPAAPTTVALAADPDGISTAAEVGNNGTLVLSGALASGNVAVLDPARKVTITSGGDDSLIAFDVVGTDAGGATQVETIPGCGNSGSSSSTCSSSMSVSTKFFGSVTSITAAGDPAGTVQAGVSAEQPPQVGAPKATTDSTDAPPPVPSAAAPAKKKEKDLKDAQAAFDAAKCKGFKKSSDTRPAAEKAACAPLKEALDNAQKAHDKDGSKGAAAGPSSG